MSAADIPLPTPVARGFFHHRAQHLCGIQPDCPAEEDYHRQHTIQMVDVFTRKQVEQVRADAYEAGVAGERVAVARFLAASEDYACDQAERIERGDHLDPS